MLIDSHAHLYFPKLKDRLAEVLENASTNDIGIIVNVGVDVETSIEALKQAEEFSSERLKLYSTIGLHPHDSSDPNLNAVSLPEHIQKLEEIYWSNPKVVVAVGECGLDFYSKEISNSKFGSIDYEKTKEVQIMLFTAQIELAKKLDLPLIVHCREAWVEIEEYLKSFRGVLHCYSGDVKTTKKVLATDLYISFAGNLTYPSSEALRESAKLVPLDRILVETDSPFLSPQAKRGQTNEPANVLEVAKCLAKIKNLHVEEVIEASSQNAKAIFSLTSS